MRSLSLAVALLLAATLAFARAGGGGGYSGGGGHSSGGGFSGGGYSGGGSYSSSYGGRTAADDLVDQYVLMMTRHPFIGIPLTLFLLFLVIYIANLGNESRVYSTISDASEVQEVRRMSEALAALKARDPAFESAAFLARAQAAFLKIQEAWSGQDMAAARAFISDGVMERFSIQIEMQKAEKFRNKMDQVRVLGAEILEIESDPHFDTLHVRVAASAVDTDVSLTDGSVLRGSGDAEEFVEVWSYLRRPGAKTLAKPGLIEGFCPSCGAPLAIADAALCASCKSWVNSGEYDWVLCEITQECEWAVRGGGESVPGFTELSGDDPALNTQFLEDRASVAFWRWQAAQCAHSSAILRPAATEDLCRKVEAETSYHRDAAVGAVEVLALEPGADFDRAHVSVKWSGDRYEGGSFQEKVLRQHVFILRRKSGARTDPRSGLVSARCATCGAPPASREDAKCAYCGAAFNDGSRQWVAAEIVPIGLWRAPAAPGQAAPSFDMDWARDASPAETLAVLVAAMMADGRIDPKELLFLEAYAAKNGIDDGRIGSVISAAKTGELSIPRPKTPQEAEVCLRGLIRMSLADGRVQEEEMNVMQGFARSMNLPDDQLRGLIKEERLALYRDAKDGPQQA